MTSKRDSRYFVLASAPDRVSPIINLKLFSLEIIFAALFTTSQTDGQTDDILWHNSAPRSIAR